MTTSTPPLPAKPAYGFQSPEAKEFPPIIVLENTTVCNLRCIHCPQGQGYPEHPEYRPVWMKWHIWTRVIDEIAQFKINHLRIAAAGESILHPEFVDQMLYAKEKGVSPIILTTNGLTLDNPAKVKGVATGKSILEALLEMGLDTLDISVDAATKEKYESIRLRSNYHRLWSNLHRALYLREKLKSPTKLFLSIIDQPESHGEVQQFVDTWTPLVDRVFVRGYLTSLGMSPDKPGTAIDQMKAEMEAKGVERWPCPQFWKRITINPDGDIRFCVVDWLDHTKMGNIQTHSIRDLWHSAEYDRMRSDQLEGRFAATHNECGPCTDWMAMRWDWSYDAAVSKVLTGTDMPDVAPPLQA